MATLPDTDRSLVLRTDFSDPSAWSELRRLMELPSEDGFRAQLSFVDDPDLRDLSLDQLMALVRGSMYRTFFFVADHRALADPEHAVLVVDTNEQSGRTFRVVPSEAWSVENNLSLSNMDFSEFADNADADGVFRGFR